MPFLDVTCLESFHFGIIPTSFIITELLQLKDNPSPDILDLDGVALSNAAHIIAPSLQIIFNKSLELGHVPDDWKLAHVTPLYKGTGFKDDRSNYRPISVISHIPKIIEKFVSFMLNKYLFENSLLKNDQFAYVKYQSTVNALHTVVDIALNNINNSMLTGIVQLDLRKGFDTINHKILLYKLQKYGINSNCLSWFQSYLNHRKQIVKCNNKLPVPCNLTIGVPQGTILGPTLFILYINDFSTFVDPVICLRYADDTSLVACGKNIIEIQEKLQTGTDKALQWLHNNRLLVNSNKSSCLLLGSRQRLNNLSLNISISGVGLNMCTETKLLRIIIDNSLSWEKQIEHVCSKVSPKIGILYRLSKFLSQNILNIIYNTIIQPDFDYCVTVWGNCSSVHFNKLQKLQNRAARIICKEFDWNIRSEDLHYVSEDLTYTHQYHSYNTRAASNNILILNKPNCEIFKTLDIMA